MTRSEALTCYGRQVTDEVSGVSGYLGPLFIFGGRVYAQLYTGDGSVYSALVERLALDEERG